MLRDVLETFICGLTVFVFGYLFSRPGETYWLALMDVIGGFLTIFVTLGACVGFGCAVRRFTPITPGNFAIGGLLAYLIGMYLIEANMLTDSPVHFYWYGLMLASTVFGHAGKGSLDLFLRGFVDMVKELTPR